MAPHFPDAAVDWLLPSSQLPVLDLDGALSPQLRGHKLVAAYRDAHIQPCQALRVAANPAALPFRARTFDAALTTTPDLLVSPVLADVARLLAPGGHLGVASYARDDTVPWVKRLARRLQADDPTAMRATAATLLDNIENAEHFTDAEQRSFRRWVPISRAGLLAMADRRPRIRALPEAARESLFDDIAAIHDGAARPGEKLQLPFAVVCVRARVDHSRLAPPPPPSDGLSIRL